MKFFSRFGKWTTTYIPLLCVVLHILPILVLSRSFAYFPVLIIIVSLISVIRPCSKSHFISKKNLISRIWWSVMIWKHVLICYLVSNRTLVIQVYIFKVDKVSSAVCVCFNKLSNKYLFHFHNLAIGTCFTITNLFLWIIE